MSLNVWLIFIKILVQEIGLEQKVSDGFKPPCIKPDLSHCPPVTCSSSSHEQHIWVGGGGTHVAHSWLYFPSSWLPLGFQRSTFLFLFPVGTERAIEMVGGKKWNKKIQLGSSLLPGCSPETAAQGGHHRVLINNLHAFRLLDNCSWACRSNRGDGCGFFFPISTLNSFPAFPVPTCSCTPE